jgi:ribosomal protein S18 acetylase RimI-like enzyme
MPGSREVTYEPFGQAHLASTVELCRALSWPSYLDPKIAMGAFTAPGAVTCVALAGTDVVGLAHLLTDCHVQVHLSLVGVLPAYRRQGIARVLIRDAYRAGGSKWLDLVSEAGSEDFYRSFLNQEGIGFRLYPEAATRDSDEPDVD